MGVEWPTDVARIYTPHHFKWTIFPVPPRAAGQTFQPGRARII